MQRPEGAVHGRIGRAPDCCGDSGQRAGASGAATFRIAQFQITLAPEQERLAVEKKMESLLAGLEADGKRLVDLETGPDMRASFDTAAAIAITLMAAGALAWPVVRRIVRMLKQAGHPAGPVHRAPDCAR